MANDKLDEKVFGLMELVEQKKAEISKMEKTARKWVTNCSVKVSFQNEPVNLQTASLEVVKKVVVDLIKNASVEDQAAEILGLEKSEKIFGYKMEDWIADCKTRADVISLRNKKAELEKIEARLGKVVSEEQRRQIEIEAISKELS